MQKLMVMVTFLCILSAPAIAQQGEIFAPEGKAIRGYDVVAFFKQGKPVPGFDSLHYAWKQAEWLFATQEDMDAFRANPEAYAPQFGGYCAYGTAAGHKAATETDTWTITDGKLYFNYNQKVKEAWMKKQAELIQKANENWLKIKDQ
ncbi:MAG TPA: YHS domain-containing (seleno)protein [Sediminibacterium sp.]|nr:YHS domain-containing (seleno)protein [Sediminibacterium sp.]